jgi:glycine oxidase
VAPSRDIVVVGAGIVGCALAYELARRGASVEVVDDRPAGMGATQAAAGVLAPFIEARDGGPLLELTARALDIYDEFIQQVTSDSRQAIRYQRTGTIDVALDETWLSHLQATHAMLSSTGIESQLLDGHAARSAEPLLTANVVGGLFIPCHGAVSPTDLTRALVAAARRHGAQVLEQGRARRITRSATELIVETERGSLSGDRVIIAAGSWAGQLEIDGALRAPVSPIRGQLLQLAWNSRTPRHVLWGERCYVVPWSEHALLVGATMEDVGFDERATVAGVQTLLGAVTELLPEIRHAPFVQARVGLRPATPDGLPIIGPSQALPGLTYATGHFRNGVLLAPLTARLVADMVLEDRYDALLERTAPGRFGHL